MAANPFRLDGELAPRCSSNSQTSPFPLLLASYWQKCRRLNWRRESRREFWLFVPSVSWPQLWLIKERIAIPAPRHAMSHRPCCIFCQGLVPAHLHRKKEKESIIHSYLQSTHTKSRNFWFSVGTKLSQITATGHFGGWGVMAVIPSGNNYCWHVVHLTSHFYKGHTQKNSSAASQLFLAISQWLSQAKFNPSSAEEFHLSPPVYHQTFQFLIHVGICSFAGDFFFVCFSEILKMASLGCWSMTQKCRSLRLKFQDALGLQA